MIINSWKPTPRIQYTESATQLGSRIQIFQPKNKKVAPEEPSHNAEWFEDHHLKQSKLKNAFEILLHSAFGACLSES